MRVRLIAAGTRSPAWVNEGYADVRADASAGLRLELVEIPVPRRGADGEIARAVAGKARRMLAAIGGRTTSLHSRSAAVR